MPRMWLNLATEIKDEVDWHSSDDRVNVLVSMPQRGREDMDQFIRKSKAISTEEELWKKRKRKETRKRLNN